ncbi:hypothetical protein ACIRF8_11025 [Streptomyces sp. NPDC102406]|uniref:hypothetical protein n=1 Tax=Streptomyces sp. NPDC102406 TaxID=3366171 RepID=UPI0038037B94
MDVHTLGEALRRAGVPAAYYWVEGVHEPAPTPPDFLYLRRTSDGAWETGAYERGAHRPISAHPSEQEACAHLLSLLVTDPAR